MKNEKENVIKFLEKFNYSKQYSKELYAKTKMYQQKYGFQLGEGKEDTHNNEADAFKHTFGSAEIALKTYIGLSKAITDYHEIHQKDNPPYEENMDKWNNFEGRKIAEEIKKDYSNESIRILFITGRMDDIIAERVMQKMKRGKLITNPFTDSRKFDEKTYKDKIFNIKNRVFHKNEISLNTLDNPVIRDAYLEQAFKHKHFPTKEELDERVQAGELVYVSEYTRGGWYKSNGILSLISA